MGSRAHRWGVAPRGPKRSAVPARLRLRMRARRAPITHPRTRSRSAVMAMNIVTETAQIGEATITIETGRLAKQASSVVVALGDTAVLVTAVSAPEPKLLPFLP